MGANWQRAREQVIKYEEQRKSEKAEGRMLKGVNEQVIATEGLYS